MDEMKSMKELQVKFTNASITDFLVNEWSLAKYKTEEVWQKFVKNSKYLKLKPIEENFIEEIDGTPYLNIGYETYERLKENGIDLSEEERNDFEACMCYLMHEKKLEANKVKKSLHKIVKDKKPFLETIKNSKSLRTDEAKKIMKSYQEEWRKNYEI